MKKIFFSGLMALALCTSTIQMVHAEDAPSAPNVVAPAQPAAVQNTNPTLAGSTASTPVAPPASSPLQMALPFVVMLGVMYFLMIRPQQKRMKDHKNLMSELKNGDEVVTNSGIIGTIAGMSEKVVTLEVSKNVQLKILRSQVNQVVKGSIQDIQPTT
jgi:preprotein translocase subunit YajC